MGVAGLLLVDKDPLDTPSNVRRVFGSKLEDLRERPTPMKVNVVAEHLRSLGLAVDVDVCDGDVRTETAFRRLLDVDVVLCGTDTHGSRAVLNDLPYSYLLPVIDTGVRVGSRADGRLAGLVAELRMLTPTTPCLWCRGVLNADTIRIENLPEEQLQRLEREGYLTGGRQDSAPSIVALTVMASGMAACALLVLLSDDAVAGPAGYLFDGQYGDAYRTGPETPTEVCRCRRSLGMGDHAAPPFVDAERPCDAALSPTRERP
jgi:hypothetical protein